MSDHQEPLKPAPEPPRRPPDFRAPLWERILSYIAMFTVIVVVLFLALRNTPFTDQNLVVFVRILISLAAGTWGATIPGMFNIEAFYRATPQTQLIIRASGAAAFFLVTFFGTPKVLGEKLPVAFTDPTLSVSSVGHDLDAIAPSASHQDDQRLAGQKQLWKTWLPTGMGITGEDRLLVVRATFEQPYLPFYVRVKFPDCTVMNSDNKKVVVKNQNSVFELRQGIAFLVSGQDDTIEGQLDFTIADDGQGGANPNNDNLLIIDGATDRVTLLLVAHLVPRAGQTERLNSISPFRKQMIKLVRLPNPATAQCL